MTPWKTRGRRRVLEHGPFLTVEEHSVELPDGRVIEDWPWIITPDFVNVVALDQEQKFLCFRQTKYGIGGTSLAPVGGYLEPGEDPLRAAQRELLEETGYESSDWMNLGSYRVDPNRGVAMAYLFLARGVRRVSNPTADDLEEQELLRLTEAEVRAALAAGDFKVLAWAAAMEFALQRLAALGV